MFGTSNVIYWYDGTYEGFLCCVFTSYQNREIPAEIWPPDLRQSSLFPLVQIETMPIKANRVENSLRVKMPSVHRMVQLGFLNDSEGKELKLLRFIHLAYEKGDGAASMLAREDVAAVRDLARAVEGEAHLLKGFIRFEEREGMLGAVISPKHCVLPLLHSHFRQRFPQENFLIYDNRHCVALLRQNGKTSYTEFAGGYLMETPEEREAAYQKMWKAFFQAVNIEQRRNEKVQMGNCPKRFWQNMVELREQA